MKKEPFKISLYFTGLVLFIFSCTKKEINNTDNNIISDSLAENDVLQVSNDSAAANMPTSIDIQQDSIKIP